MNKHRTFSFHSSSCWKHEFCKSSLFNIQNPRTVFSLLFLVCYIQNGCKAGFALTMLVTSSGISVMLSINSLCVGANASLLRDNTCCTLYGFDQPQWLESLFNGSPFLKRTASQKSDFSKLNPIRLIGKTVNQLNDPCSCAISFNLISMLWYCVAVFLLHNKVC